MHDQDSSNEENSILETERASSPRPAQAKTPLGPLPLTAGVSGGAGAWVGVIRQGKKVFWKCSHSHCNRHETSGTNPISAYTCASHVLAAMLRPDSTEIYERWRNGAYFTSGWQARHATLILNLHRWADKQASTLLDSIRNLGACVA